MTRNTLCEIECSAAFLGWLGSDSRLSALAVPILSAVVGRLLRAAELTAVSDVQVGAHRWHIVRPSVVPTHEVAGAQNMPARDVVRALDTLAQCLPPQMLQQFCTSPVRREFGCWYCAVVPIKTKCAGRLASNFAACSCRARELGRTEVSLPAARCALLE